MLNIDEYEKMNPYVRMMRLKRTASLSGKWRDIDHVFTYIASGQGDFIIDGNHYTLKTGDVIIIPPLKTHIIISQGFEPLVQYIMHFDFFEKEERIGLQHKNISEEVSYRIPDEEKFLNEVLVTEINMTDRTDISRIYLSMLREFEDRKPCRNVLLKAGCMQLLTYTFRSYMSEDRIYLRTQPKQTKSWIHIENAIKYINECKLDYELDNDTIAEQIGISPNYLTRIFQEHLGMSLHRYIINVKIERAQKNMLSGNVNITEAAEEAGFSSVHVFSKTFKNLFGISPSEFLNQNCGTKNEE